MKKMKQFASAALAALLLAGSAPSALALDTTPPMYKQFGYDSAEEYMEQESYYGVFDYDTLSDHYRQHLNAVRSNPTLAVEYWRGIRTPLSAFRAAQRRVCPLCGRTAGKGKRTRDGSLPRHCRGARRRGHI